MEVDIQILWRLPSGQFVEELWITLLLRFNPFSVVLKNLLVGLGHVGGDRSLVCSHLTLRRVGRTE
jgi:hypothetical protein